MHPNVRRQRPPRDLWTRALRDPSLRDLPYKVETNEHGQLVLTPHKPRDSLQQGRIAALLRERAAAAGLPPGEATTEFAVETSGGIKVPDVVWISAERLASLPEDAETSPVMPEIIVEVLSKTDTQAEMADKRRLYFEAGTGILDLRPAGTARLPRSFGPDPFILDDPRVPRVADLSRRRSVPPSIRMRGSERRAPEGLQSRAERATM
jgi:hypothetical protein